MKIITIFFTSILTLTFLSACSDSGKSNSSATEKTQMADVWFKYDEPINGYAVKFHCIQAFEGNPNYFSIELYQENDSVNIQWATTELIALERIWKEEYRNTDTIVLHNTHKELGSPLLDFNNIVYFEDLNFDGEDELVICMSPRYDSVFLSQLDCENFLVFNVDHTCMTPCDNNSFVREIANGLCRTEYKVDKAHKTITLTGYLSTCSYTEKVYWFKDGFPYKLDYTYVDNGVKYPHHFTLIDAEIDSVEKLENYLL